MSNDESIGDWEMDADIKPCGWCGKKPEQNQDSLMVYCFNPHCLLFRFETDVESWNTRPHETSIALIARNEAIKECAEIASCYCGVKGGYNESDLHQKMSKIGDDVQQEILALLTTTPQK